MLFNELESILKGLIILNAAPCLWFEEAEKCRNENNLPPLGEPLENFRNNPNPETFKIALLACAHYYFLPGRIEAGKEFLAKIPFNYLAAHWWQKKALEINFNATWIPQSVPTLILGASHDFVTPFSLFESDQRFRRENITLKKIENAGHFPWIEKIAEVQSAFEGFFRRYFGQTNFSKCKKSSPGTSILGEIIR